MKASAPLPTFGGSFDYAFNDQWIFTSLLGLFAIALWAAVAGFGRLDEVFFREALETLARTGRESAPAMWWLERISWHACIAAVGWVGLLALPADERLEFGCLQLAVVPVEVEVPPVGAPARNLRAALIDPAETRGDLVAVDAQDRDEQQVGYIQ